jgi:DNA-binding NtrC family response regulator
MKKISAQRVVSGGPNRRKHERAKSARPPVVLLVDDNPDLRDMIMMALTDVAKLRVVDAANSKVALSLASRHKLDLVISDIARPGMNGLKFLKLFKKSYPLVPVIIASGDPSGSTEVRARELGAYAFLAKPFLLETLLELVSQALAQGANGASPWLPSTPLRSRLLHGVEA